MLSDTGGVHAFVLIVLVGRSKIVLIVGGLALLRSGARGAAFAIRRRDIGGGTALAVGGCVAAGTVLLFLLGVLLLQLPGLYSNAVLSVSL